MTDEPKNKRVIRIFRFDPAKEEDGHFDRYELSIIDESKTTILDVLFKIQKMDPSLAFRYACRVSMCGSCGMVINGREGLACKTVVSDIKEKEIRLQPLNHFPIVKDLVVDMEPFFNKFQEALPFFDAIHEKGEPARIRPDSNERRDIGLSTECIACGCCVSSCTMVYHHKDYLGPAALNRAFTLLADGRDALFHQRVNRVLPSCYHCRSEFNCTEICPKEISPTRAIKSIQRLAIKAPFRASACDFEGKKKIHTITDHPLYDAESSRRRFLQPTIFGLGAATTLVLGGVIAAATIGPSMRESLKQEIRLGKITEFIPGKIKTINVRYRVKDGFYNSQSVKPVMVFRKSEENDFIVYNSRCTHLGCSVRWDEGKQRFLCACHGGAFDRNGRVKAGPPPRLLDRYAFHLLDGNLFLTMA